MVKSKPVDMIINLVEKFKPVHILDNKFGAKSKPVHIFDCQCGGKIKAGTRTW